MDEPQPTFDYANVTGRPSAPFVVVLARVLPGVASVAGQHEAYAESWRAANLAALARPGPRWIVLGDSLSQGIGASRFDAGWVNRVHARLRDEGFGYEIVNLSASGARAGDVLAQQVPAWRALPPAPEPPAPEPPAPEPPAPEPPASGPPVPGPAAVRPDLVSLLIGSNDLLSRTHRDQLPEVFGELLRQLPDRAVVATLPQPRRAARAANAEIAAAQLPRRLIVVDMSVRGPKSWRGKLAADHFHPNEAGYEAIAEAFTDPILTALRTGDV